MDTPSIKPKKCKNCDNPVKIRKYADGSFRYNKTCGNRNCYIKRDFKLICVHCKNEYFGKTTQSKWCKICVPNKFSQGIMMRYGISHKEYLDMLQEASGKCHICRKHNATVVDHDHKTGRVRGILCTCCNMSIYLIENKEMLDRAIKYVRNE